MNTAVAEPGTVNHAVVSREQWIAARKALLAREKELTRLEDRVAAERRALPWVRIDEGYVFEGPEGRRTLAEIERFRRRMGWRFKWLSAHAGDFNYDFGVSFTAEERAKGQVLYNYAMQPFAPEEMPGISVFYKDDAGKIFHTYSTYGRGVEVMMGTYDLLDLTPKGRDERNASYTMDWVRHHDRYEPQPAARAAGACCSALASSASPLP